MTGPAPPPAQRFRPGDLSGGFASAIVSITGNVAAGIIAFAPLGPEYAGRGILAGMLASVVAGLLAALTGSAPGLITGPKATTAMAFAALLSQLLATGRFDLASPEGAEMVLALAFGAVLVSGSIQVLLGAFRVGTLVRFMPYPVVAGIRNTAAILLITGQFWPFVGVPRQDVGSLLADLGQIQPATVAVATVTALLAWKGGKFMAKSAVPVMALLAGAVLYYVLAPIPGLRLGPTLGALPSLVPDLSGLVDRAAVLGDRAYWNLLPAVVMGGLAIAVLDSISALITLVSYQSLADRRFDANDQLRGQGIGTAVGALVGSLSTSGILARAAVNHRAGGRTAGSGVVNALGVLVLVVVLARPLALLPKAAIAGLIMVIAAGLVDRWSLRLFTEARGAPRWRRKELYGAAAEMLFVVAVGLAVNLVAAVGAGVALSVLVFVARMSRSPIRRVRRGSTVRSTRRWSEDKEAALRAHGDRIALVELEGTIFFGSCDAVATEVEALADDGAELILLDMRRVPRGDATGYKVLAAAVHRLAKSGVTVSFGYVSRDSHSAEMAEGLIANGVAPDRLFATSDAALEAHEETLLSGLGLDAARPQGWTVQDFGRSWALNDEEVRALEGVLARREFAAGEAVFKAGQTSRSMFLLSRGSADVMLTVERDGGARRVSSLTAGTVFGELALLDGSARSADVRAVTPLVCYELTEGGLAELGAASPGAGRKIFAALARLLGTRLKEANALIRELDA